MNTVTISADQQGPHIDRNVYGVFAEHLGLHIYDGIWVGHDSTIPNTRGIRNDVVEALRQVNVPVIRWPGGCFADEYHWRDGVGPDRAPIINTHWGQVVEPNTFGTHEFFDFCEMVGAAPYVCGNVGSGTVQEMQQWVEYITADVGPMADLRRQNGREQPWRLPYFGVGNENWGCGGFMRPEYYADLYRRYRVYVRDLGGERITCIACGANADDYTWTDVLMREACRFFSDSSLMGGLSLHYYTVPRIHATGQRGPATGFGEDEWFITLKRGMHMKELVQRHGTIMDRYDPEKRVMMVVDEWGTWYDVEEGTNPGFLYQQNTMRDALVAGLTLNIFNEHADRVRMANVAQTVNVLQALLLTDGPRMITTPTYHVFDLYRDHQGATAVPCAVQAEPYTYNGGQVPGLSASASRDGSGKINITVCNTNPHRGADTEVTLHGAAARSVEGRLLTGDAMDAHNTFQDPTRVAPRPFDAVERRGDSVTVTFPPMSVVQLSITV